MMTENNFYELPKNWVWTKIRAITELIKGVTYEKQEASKEAKQGYAPILRANNISDKINYDELVYVPCNRVKEEQYIIKYDILLAMSSGSKHLVGKAAQVLNDFDGGFGAFCGLIRVSGEINKKIIGYFFKSSNYRQMISKLSSGVNINNLRREHIESIPIPIPPLPEQHRIIAKIEELFSDLDAGVEALKKAKAQLRLYRQAVLKAAFEGRLTAAWREAHKNFSEIQMGWIRVKLGDFIEPSNERVNPTLLQKVPYIGLEHIKKGTGRLLGSGSSDEVRSTKSRFFRGDLLYGKLRPYLNKVLIAEFDGVCSTDILVFPKSPHVSMKFLAHRFLCNDFVRYASLNVSGVQHPRVDFLTLSKFIISLPPLPEQMIVVQEIEHRFSIIDDLEKTVEDSLRHSDRLRQGILKKAFAGELVPQDPEDEPAEKLLERIKGEKAGHDTGKKPGRRAAQRDLNYG